MERIKRKKMKMNNRLAKINGTYCDKNINSNFLIFIFVKKQFHAICLIKENFM